MTLERCHNWCGLVIYRPVDHVDVDAEAGRAGRLVSLEDRAESTVP